MPLAGCSIPCFSKWTVPHTNPGCGSGLPSPAPYTVIPTEGIILGNPKLQDYAMTNDSQT